MEEVGELVLAKTKKEYVAELADIVDVIEELRKKKKITNIEFAIARENVFNRKGGFQKRLFLEWSEDDG